MTEPTVIGAFDAKTHLSELLQRVADGESFVITRRGSPIARLVPAGPIAVKPSVDALLVKARLLREQVKATPEEVRVWIEEGRR
jgi:prevent-host-death family protein